ncbi:MAG: hypothetical protein M1546_18235 [Chloroflexi bacterium]|nr:hypothetical protein [Chloroflexota bacterium]
MNMQHTGAHRFRMDTSLISHHYQTLIAVLLCAVLLLLGLSIYLPTLYFNFFCEDPFDIGQVDDHTYLGLLSTSNSNEYYRPLTLITMKLLRGSGPEHTAFPYHALNVGAHLVTTLTLFGAARHWFRNTTTAFVAATLFAVYPVAFEATARAISPHPITTGLIIGALWSYTSGREGRHATRITLAILLTTIALFIQENAILVTPMVFLLELYLCWQRRVRSCSPILLLFLIPTAFFITIWLSIPKAAAPPQLGLHPLEALYLSQGLSYPFARLISATGGWGLAPTQQAMLALFLSLALLALVCPKTARPQFVLALALWLTASSLAWVARTMDYLEVSPRLMYFPSFAAALVWASALFGVKPARMTARMMFGVLASSAIVVQSGAMLSLEVMLYQKGPALMDQLIAAGRNGGKMLFVNFPDRMEYRDPLYPLGYWGVLVAPVSQDLSDFVRFATGINIEATSISDLPLAAEMMNNSPYRVNTRGSDAHASALLYETILGVDRVYWTDYDSDGRLALRLVGDISADRADQITNERLDRIGPVAEVLAASVQPDDDHIDVTVGWHSLSTADPTDTIFLHVLDHTGRLVAQKDGGSLNGLVPPSAWRAGHFIEDRRRVTLNAPLLPGDYQLAIGIYNSSSGERYRAYNARGEVLSDGALTFAWFTIR